MAKVQVRHVHCFDGPGVSVPVITLEHIRTLSIFYEATCYTLTLVPGYLVLRTRYQVPDTLITQIQHSIYL